VGKEILAIENLSTSGNLVVSALDVQVLIVLFEVAIAPVKFRENTLKHRFKLVQINTSIFTTELFHASRYKLEGNIVTLFHDVEIRVRVAVAVGAGAGVGVAVRVGV